MIDFHIGANFPMHPVSTAGGGIKGGGLSQDKKKYTLWLREA